MCRSVQAPEIALVRFSYSSKRFIEIIIIYFIAGQKFAMLEMKSIVSKVLRKFELSLPENYEPILIAEMILRPENGLMIKFNRRVNV